MYFILLFTCMILAVLLGVIFRVVSSLGLRGKLRDFVISGPILLPLMRPFLRKAVVYASRKKFRAPPSDEEEFYGYIPSEHFDPGSFLRDRGSGDPGQDRYFKFWRFLWRNDGFFDNLSPRNR